MVIGQVVDDIDGGSDFSFSLNEGNLQVGSSNKAIARSSSAFLLMLSSFSFLTRFENAGELSSASKYSELKMTLISLISDDFLPSTLRLSFGLTKKSILLYCSWEFSDGVGWSPEGDS